MQQQVARSNISSLALHSPTTVAAKATLSLPLGVSGDVGVDPNLVVPILSVADDVTMDLDSNSSVFHPTTFPGTLNTAADNSTTEFHSLAVAASGNSPGILLGDALHDQMLLHAQEKVASSMLRHGSGIGASLNEISLPSVVLGPSQSTTVPDTVSNPPPSSSSAMDDSPLSLFGGDLGFNFIELETEFGEEGEQQLLMDVDPITPESALPAPPLSNPLKLIQNSASIPTEASIGHLTAVSADFTPSLPSTLASSALSNSVTRRNSASIEAARSTALAGQAATTADAPPMASICMLPSSIISGSNEAGTITGFDELYKQLQKSAADVIARARAVSASLERSRRSVTVTPGPTNGNSGVPHSPNLSTSTCGNLRRRSDATDVGRGGGYSGAESSSSSFNGYTAVPSATFGYIGSDVDAPTKQHGAAVLNHFTANPSSYVRLMPHFDDIFLALDYETKILYASPTSCPAGATLFGATVVPRDDIASFSSSSTVFPNDQAGSARSAATNTQITNYKVITPSVDRIVGTKLTSWIHEEDVTTLLKAVEKGFKTGDGYTIYVRARPRDISYLEHKSTINNHVDDNDKKSRAGANSSETSNGIGSDSPVRKIEYMPLYSCERLQEY
jgi:hypothetical protein